MAAVTPPANRPAQVDLGAEVRRARVEAVRGVIAELEHVEKVLLDVQARLPTLLNQVRNARMVIDVNTAPAGAGDSEEETS